MESRSGICSEREGGMLFKGAVLSHREDEVYVGEPVARILRLSVGDSVSFLIQTEEGAMNSLDALVCGILQKGAPWASG